MPATSQAPSYYPLLLDLTGRRCVVVGGGHVAEEKVVGLLAAGAKVVVVAERLGEGLGALLEHEHIEQVARSFEPTDLDGAFLAFAERIDEETNAALFRAAEERAVFCNVQDDVPHCSVIAPSIVRKGELIVAISTSGAAPAYAVRLRQRLQHELGEDVAAFLDLCRCFRAPLAREVPDFDERRRRWYALVDSDVLELFAQGDLDAARETAEQIMGISPDPLQRNHDEARLAATLRDLDDLHRADPNTEPEAGGRSLPAELLYARRMTAWLERLDPSASPELQIAVRAQHLERWKSSRSDYPEGRAGYLRWRREAARRHAERTDELMACHDWPNASRERVASLVQKKDRQRDVEAQTLEDCACLVFLEHHLTAFVETVDEEKAASVLEKTWGKMSEGAQAEARRLTVASMLPGSTRLI